MKYEVKMEDGTVTPMLPECTLCGVEPETLEHLFITCQYTNELWVKLENILNYTFSKPEKILGCFDKMHFYVILILLAILQFF